VLLIQTIKLSNDNPHTFLLLESVQSKLEVVPQRVHQACSFSEETDIIFPINKIISFCEKVRYD
jgi:hypothetical protein